jgi:hypothetical protein
MLDHLLHKLDSHFQSHVNLVGLATGGLVLQNDIDDYITLLIDSQYCPLTERAVGALRSTIWLYYTNPETPCPENLKAMAAQTLKSTDIVLWPLFNDCEVGHWLLVVIYTRSNHVCLIDSCVDEKHHAEVFQVTSYIQL